MGKVIKNEFDFPSSYKKLLGSMIEKACFFYITNFLGKCFYSLYLYTVYQIIGFNSISYISFSYLTRNN